MQSKFFFRIALLTLLGVMASQLCRAQATPTCSAQQRQWLLDRNFSTDQGNSLCANGIEFLENAATITFRFALLKGFVSEVLSIPVSVPAAGQFSVAAVAYCGLVPDDNAIAALVALTSQGGPPMRLNDQDCTATLAALIARPGTGGVARFRLKWIPWRLQLRLTDGMMKLPDGTTTAIQPFTVADLPTDAVKIDLPDGTVTWHAAFFISSSLTLALAPDSAANFSLPAATTVIPANERIPNGRALNTTIRLPEKAINSVAIASTQARYKFPTGDPRIGDVTLSNFAWTLASGAPVVKSNIADANGHSFKASIGLGSQQFGWLALTSASLEAIEKPCSGNALSQAQCRLENAALRDLAPVAANIFVARYSHTAIRPFSTETVFPFTLGNKRLQFQGILYSLLAYPRSADLIMHCQFAIGELP